MADLDPNHRGSRVGTSSSDSSLLREFRAGDENAAECLFDKYVRRVDALAQRRFGKEAWQRVDTEDLTQSIFRTLFRRLRSGEYDVPPGETIWKLLATVTLNKVRAVGAFHRAAKRDVRRNEPFAQQILEGHCPGDDEATVQILKLTIEELIADLPETDRRIIELRLESHDIVSISQLTERSRRTVERVLQGFRERLREVLNDADE